MRGIRALWLMLMLLTADGVSAQLVEKVLRGIEGDSGITVGNQAGVGSSPAE